MDGTAPPPLEWRLSTMGHLVDVKGGKRLPKGHRFSETPTDFPYIRVVDFENHTVNQTALQYLVPEDRQTLHRYTISSADVYISIAGTIGLAGTVPNELSGANLTENAARLIIRNPNELDANFLVFYLSSEHGKDHIRVRTAKTSQPKLALDRIKQIPIRLPPVREQRAIVGALTKVRTATESRRREVALERERKSALMQKLFTYGTRGEARKVTEIGEIPQCWQILPLGEVLTLQRGFDLPSQHREVGSVPIISSSGRSGTHSIAKVKAPGVVVGRSSWLRVPR